MTEWGINKNTESGSLKMGWSIVERLDGILFTPIGAVDDALAQWLTRSDVARAKVVVCDIDCPARWSIVVKWENIT